MNRPLFNLRVFVGRADLPERAVAAAEAQVRDYLMARQWKRADGGSVYDIKMTFHTDGYGCTCAIQVMGPDDPSP